MKSIPKVAALVVFVLLSVCGSSEAYVQWYELDPPEPTPEDTIEIRIYGWWGDPCYDSAISEITVTGDTIQFNINHYSMECVEMCVAVMWPYQVLDTIFPVEAGDYTIWFHENLVYVCDSIVDPWHSWESYFPLSIPGDPCENCLAGDANLDGVVSIGDVTSMIAYVFSGGAAPACQISADVDESGDLTIGDALGIIRHIFMGEVVGGCRAP